MKLRNLVSLSALAVLPAIAVTPGCATEEPTESTPPQNVTEVNHANRGKWAVDMKKVDEHYGRSSSLFLGLTSEEAALPPVVPGHVIWDLTAKREANGELAQETGDEIAVIDREGNEIDPVGYVNIIPMYQNTKPTEQSQIKEFLRDGDVIVYIHPEQTGARGPMERRASHVGMHYEYTTEGGEELVHHIDNPNSYGPVYNHLPTRHMPFNVYRFKPKSTDLVGGGDGNVVETVEGVTFTTSQRDTVLELVNSGDVSSDEARDAVFKKLDVEIGLRADAAGRIVQYRYHNGDIASLEVLSLIPRVGPAALQTLRSQDAGSAEGQPLTAAQAEGYGMNARNWAMMTNDQSPFASFFDLRLQRLDDVSTFANNAINGMDIPDVYCSGLAYTNMNLALNYPLNQGALGPELWQTFSSSSYYFSDAGADLPAATLADTMNLPSLNRLVFEPYQATDILNAWIENYWGAYPLPVKQQIFQDPQFQQQVVSGFSQLEWSDDQSDEKQSAGAFSPATLQNVQRWALAYGRTAEDTEAFLAADAELKAAFDEVGISGEGMTPMDVLQTVEDKFVQNKFVPPQIWMDEADRDDSSLVYVGTVLNCEILSAVDGSSDPCSGGGEGGVTTFSEGASDSSTYPDFAIANGGERTHRRFDVVGPTHIGPESEITARLSHGDVADARFLLHVPSLWSDHVTADLAYGDYTAWCDEQRAMGGSCAAKYGIILDPGQSGPVSDATFRWTLGDVCAFSEDGTKATCPVATLEGGYQVASEAMEIDMWANGGHISVTMADLGGTSSAEIENCSACTESGGQYNQFTVNLIQPE